MSDHREQPFPGEVVDVRMTGELTSEAVEEDCHTWEIISDRWTATVRWNGYGRRPVTRRREERAPKFSASRLVTDLVHVAIGAALMYWYLGG